MISELYIAPVRPSANPASAGPSHRWSSTLSSGPERIATPFSAEDSHLLLHAAFRRRFHYFPLPPKLILRSVDFFPYFANLHLNQKLPFIFSGRWCEFRIKDLREVPNSQKRWLMFLLTACSKQGGRSHDGRHL